MDMHLGKEYRSFSKKRSTDDKSLLILNDIYYDANTWTHAYTSKQRSVTEQQNSDTTGHKYSKGHRMIVSARNKCVILLLLSADEVASESKPKGARKVLDLTTAVAVTPGTTILPTQVNHVCLPLLYVYQTPTSVDYFHSLTLPLSSVPLRTLNILNVLEVCFVTSDISKQNIPHTVVMIKFMVLDNKRIGSLSIMLFAKKATYVITRATLVRLTT
uniref:Uncharacterized protein n=1 Tax=Glossina austeni TaxID=7395 RepID=A0A1A9VAJ4_GLOAU